MPSVYEEPKKPIPRNATAKTTVRIDDQYPSLFALMNELYGLPNSESHPKEDGRARLRWH